MVSIAVANSFCKIFRIVAVPVKIAFRNYALKSSLPITWKAPERISCIRPEKSGDLKPVIEVDPKRHPLEFKDSEELNSADDNVKRLFTLEFFPNKKTVETLRTEYLKKVKRHELDRSSPEARVANMTASIRCMQKMMEKFPRNKRMKVRLKELIDKRKKLLKFLRMWDYKCFEWVLENLELTYKPFPDNDVYRRIERKRSLRMLTTKFCDNIISSKLTNYKESLEAEQEAFLLNKIETLKWIMKEELECGVEPTVSEADVAEVQNQLALLKMKNKKDEANNLL